MEPKPLKEKLDYFKEAVIHDLEKAIDVDDSTMKNIKDSIESNFEDVKEDIYSAVEWLDKKVALHWGLNEHNKRSIRKFIKQAFESVMKK